MGKTFIHPAITASIPALRQTGEAKPTAKPLSADRTARARLTRKSGLDVVQEAFRADPTRGNAKAYRDVALTYWEDEMIGDETLLAALHEIKNS